MDDTVAGRNICGGDFGITNGHNPVCNGEGQICAIHSGCGQPVGDIGGCNCTCQHVVGENACEGLIVLFSGEGGQIDSGVGKCFIGWSEHGERSVTLKGFEQPCLNDRCYERIVNTGTLSDGWNVAKSDRRHEHGIDYVDDTVAGHDVCGGDFSGPYADNAVCDGERQLRTVDGSGCHSIGHICCGNCAGNDVIGENVSEGLVVFIGCECRQIDACVDEGLIGWGKDRERSIALQRFKQSGLNNCGH